ncbi:MAG: CRTAC1 family protein [Methanobacteriota archaeon]
MLLASLLFAVALGGCTSARDAPFVDASADAGVQYRVGTLTAQATANPMASLTGGVAVADYDNDGRLDLFVVDSGLNALYRNAGPVGFDLVDDAAGVKGGLDGRSAVFFDYDEDGWQDLYIVNYIDPSRLYKNEGGRFRDVTAAAGLGRAMTSHSAAAADYDRDGDLDLFVANYGRWTRDFPDNWTHAENGEKNALLRNDGNGSFTNVADAAGLTHTRWSFAAAWADYDRDGDPDLYVANDFGPDNLYRNEGDGTFVDVAWAAGARSNRNGMGATWLDIDRDGDLDLYVSNIHVPDVDVPTFHGNVLFVNDGGGNFTEEAAARGVADGLWSWDSEAFDAENDGDLDLFVATGFATRKERDVFYTGDIRLVSSDETETGEGLRKYYEEKYWDYNDTHYLTLPIYTGGQQFYSQSQGGDQPKRFFVNDGRGNFTEAAEAWGLSHRGDARGIATADFDADGDLDLVYTAFLSEPRYFRNRAPQGRHLDLLLEGTDSNRDAVGAAVYATYGGSTLVQERIAGGGFQSQSSPWLHFGLGANETVDELVVRWPSGRVDRFEDVAGNARYRLVEGGAVQRV